MSIFDVAPLVHPLQAVQLCWKNWNEVCDLLTWRINPINPGEITNEHSGDPCGESAPFIRLKVGESTARHGDWIVKLTLPPQRDIVTTPVELFFVYPPKVFDKAFTLTFGVPAESETLVAEQMRSEDA